MQSTNAPVFRFLISDRSLDFSNPKHNTIAKHTASFVVSAELSNGILKQNELPGGDHLFFLGNAVTDNQEGLNYLKEKISAGIDIEKIMQNLNGQFLVCHISEKTGTVTLANDRFCSFPVFFGLRDSIASINYFDLLDHLKNFRWRQDQFEQFFLFRRLLGENTYDDRTSFLPPASILKLHKFQAPTVLTYWHPKFEKLNHDRTFLEKTLAQTLENAVKSRLSITQRPGILLSGGADSRCALSFMPKESVAYSVCESRNHEWKIAARCAEFMGIRHDFIPRPPDSLQYQIDHASKISGGMYLLNEANWLHPTLGKKIFSNHDGIFHGYGFDYLLGDKYSLSTKLNIAGKLLRYQKAKKANLNTISQELFENVSWRFKEFPWQEWFQEKHRKRIFDSAISTLEGIKQKALNYTIDPGDIYRYFTFHNPSRHMMYFGPLTIRSFTDERAPGFDNFVFDFSLAMPHKERLNGLLYRRTLTRINRRLMDIPDANTNIPISKGPINTQIIYSTSSLLRKVGLPGLVSAVPSNGRSWTEIEEEHFNLENSRQIEELLFESIPSLDRQKIRSLLNQSNGSWGKYCALTVYQTLARFQ